MQRVVDFGEEGEEHKVGLIGLLLRRRVEEVVLGSSMSIEGTADRQTDRQVPLLVILNL